MKSLEGKVGDLFQHRDFGQVFEIIEANNQSASWKCIKTGMFGDHQPGRVFAGDNRWNDRWILINKTTNFSNLYNKLCESI